MTLQVGQNTRLGRQVPEEWAKPFPRRQAKIVVGDLNLPDDEVGLAAALAGDPDAFRELTDNTGEAIAASCQSIRPPDQRAGFRSLRPGPRGRPRSGLPGV